MKEFVEKLIERLEEYPHAKYKDDYGKGFSCAINLAIKIVNQLAEEYNPSKSSGLDKLSQEPKTRIEHIRSMSVEEMADVILESDEISTVINFCQNLCGECENIPESECKKCLIKYLNSPVEQKKVIPTKHFAERFNRVL